MNQSKITIGDTVYSVSHVFLNIFKLEDIVADAVKQGLFTNSYFTEPNTCDIINYRE